jgi:hypothetical protein
MNWAATTTGDQAMTDRIRNRLVGAAVGAAVATAATPALAMDSFFVGARGQGMAGSLTAATDDVDAQYYNPAAYGFFGKDAPDGGRLATDNQSLREKHFGIGVDAGAGARVYGDLYDYADRLSEVDDFGAYDDITSAQEASDFVGLLGDLQGIDDPENGVLMDATGGVGLRFALPWAWAPQGAGVRSYNQVGVRGSLDRQNISDYYDKGSLNTEIQNSLSYNNTRDNLSQDQYDAISDIMGDEETAKAIDDAIAGQDVTSDQIDQAIEFLSQTYGDGSYTAAVSGASLSDNQSGLIVKGFAIQSVPFTWAWSWDDVSYVGGEWSVGTNIKLMRGDVFGKSFSVFSDTDLGDQADNAWNNRETTTQVGLDVGLMGRYENWQVGLMGRNLNSPTFEAPTVDGVDLDNITAGPQVRAGLAWIPMDTLTLSTDLDLTRNQTMLNEYETQFASLGFEWDALSTLALRGGLYNNVADDQIGNVYTAGLGLNLYLLRIDLGAAVSAERETVDGNELPTEARANLEVTMDW